MMTAEYILQNIYTRTHLRFQPKITTENRIPVLLIGINSRGFFENETWTLEEEKSSSQAGGN